MRMAGSKLHGDGVIGKLRGSRRLLLISLAVTLVLWDAAVLRVEAQGTGLTNITSYTPTTNVWINCGGTQNATIPDLGTFQADNIPNIVSQGSLATNIATSNSDSDPYPALLEDARIFYSTSSYKIPVSTGGVWLRLWFYPITFIQGRQTYTPSSALFSVFANEYTLLNNLTAAVIQQGTRKYLFAEYLLVNVQSAVTITFKPEPNSIAFVNGLAVVSVPNNLVEDTLYPVPSGITMKLNMAPNALETMYRLNVGGTAVAPGNDSFLTRKWDDDSPYLYGAIKGQPTVPLLPDAVIYPTAVPEYIAPGSVYGTARTLGSSGAANSLANLTWIFNVDPGYAYYVRLHFDETVYTVRNQRVFNIYLNNETAWGNFDPVAYATEAQAACYLDFFVDMYDATVNQMWVALSPSTGNSEYKDVILNGLEIFKFNNTNASLQGTAAVALPVGGSNGGGSSGKNTGTIIGAVVGGIAALVVLIAGICFYCSRKSKGNPKNPSSAWLPLPLHGGNSESRTASKISTTASHKSGTGSYVSSAASNLGRYFTFQELQEATNNFDEDLLLGVGGFGKVYKAEIDDGTLVAVKRGNPRSEQGLTEFQTEIELLSKLRHRHLVSLIGYCEEHCEMILVYDYMANGPLRQHLYGTDLPPLSWKQRLEICVGAARGLHYLHTGAAQGIIHRDVKTTNILLDDNFVAKVADFGLSKTGPSLDRTHVSTAVKGSFGYLDPEYFRRQQLTEKSDVYSFGVVLMEVVCARPAINPALPREQVNIAEWAMQWQKMGMLEQIIDPKLVGYINPESLKKFGETSEKCLAEQGIDRPAMGDVLWNLEYALQLQENSMENRLMEGSTNRILELPLRTPEPEEPDLTTTNHSLGSEESEDASASAVFSQLVNPQGR
ncbi:unnamed protein product [Calypogeia fissa]